MDDNNTHEILELSSTKVDYTVFNVNWIPSAPRLIVCGSSLAGEGLIRIYNVTGKGLLESNSTSQPKAVRCGTFNASSLEERSFCTGDFVGNISVWDIEELDQPISKITGHSGLINCIDGCLEEKELLTTGSRDGTVKMWDRRIMQKSIVTMEGNEKKDCWSVSASSNGKYIASGFNNGDVRIFDITAGKVFWETTLPRGVTSLHFTTGDKLDKLTASIVGGTVSIWDLQTRHRSQGYTRTDIQLDKTTIWDAKCAPQKDSLILAPLGSGAIDLIRYVDPGHRVMIGSDGRNVGTPGKFLKVATKQLTDKPVTSIDWSKDKAGLVIASSFDQHLRVLLITGT